MPYSRQNQKCHLRPHRHKVQPQNPKDPQYMNTGASMVSEVNAFKLIMSLDSFQVNIVCINGSLIMSELAVDSCQPGRQQRLSTEQGR